MFAHGRASSADSFRKVPSTSSAQASGASSSRASASSKRQLSAGHRPVTLPSGVSSGPDGRQSSASRRGTINAPGPSDITVVGTVPPMLVNMRAASHQPYTVQSGSATEATKRLSSVRRPSLFAEPSLTSFFSYDEGPSDDTASFFKFDKDLQFDLQEARNFMKTLQKESKVRFEALEGDAEIADRASTANRASARQDQQSRRRGTPRKVEEPPPPDIAEVTPTPQQQMSESKIPEPHALESDEVSDLQAVAPTPATPEKAQAPSRPATPPSVELQLEPAPIIASEPEPAPEQPEPQYETVPEPIPEPHLEPLINPPPSVADESNPTPAPSSVVFEYSRPVTAAEEQVPPPPMRALKVHSPLPPPPAPSALILKPEWTVPEQRFVRAIATVSVGSLLRYVNHLKYQEQLDIIQARKYQTHDMRRSEERLGKFAIRERGVK
ncbi:hypothetical protein HDU85_002970 [Gaertneriomyces sp. JEL0708]|nr:hypothetical protein HDU85_002970 [Gaertneriomyces sp. JEL0708]